MKTLKHLALCLAAVFIATGCSNDENEPKTGAVKEGKPVKFEMNIGNANTRTVTTGSGSNRSVSWREGDAVGIFVYESTGAPTEYSNKKYEYKNGEWKASSPDDAIVLPEDGEYTFYAYYPYSASVATPAAATLSVQQDQTIADGDNGNTNYDLSDILTAKVEKITNNATITLQYKHLFSMVEVLVSGNLVSAAPASVVLKDVKTSATIDLTTDDISATSDNADVSMCPVESETTQTTYLYRAIVPTQTIEANKPLLEVYGVGADKDKNYRFTHTAAVPYEQGKYRRISVLIGENNAGITIPSGAIDEWDPSEKVDVPGEEIITPVTSITPSLNEETQLQLRKSQPSDALIDNTNFWFYRERPNDLEIIYEPTEEALKVTSIKGDRLTWNYSSFGYHWGSQPIEKGEYTLTFNAKIEGQIQSDDEVGQQLGFCVRNANDTKTFRIGDSYFKGKRVMCTLKITNEWKEYTYTIDFAKTSTKTSVGDVSDTENFTESTPEDLNGMSIVMFNYLINEIETPAQKESYSIYIKDIKLVKIEN